MFFPASLGHVSDVQRVFHQLRPAWTVAIWKHLRVPQRRTRIGLGFFVILFSIHPLMSTQVQELRCEYRSQPLGVDTPQPRFSWLLQPELNRHGLRQTAWQVEVWDAAGQLVWDSGKSIGGQSHLVPYQGKALQAGGTYHWRVRVWDETDTPSPWSEQSRWTMGLLEPADWQAEWIGSGEQFVRDSNWPPADNAIPNPWLRQSVELPAPPTSALAYIASVGYHELFINGEKVDDRLLAPASTDHSQRARYVVYDVAPYLRAGRNMIGLWLGHSWSFFPAYHTNDKPHSAIVRGHFSFDFADGSRQVLGTDAAWQWRHSPNTTLGVWDFMFYGGEKIDCGVDDSAWATVASPADGWLPVEVFTPQLVMSADLVEPNRAVTELSPLSITEKQPGVYLIDMGLNFAGFLEIRLRGQPHGVVRLQYSEVEGTAETNRLHSEVLLDALGQGLFRNRFNYHSARWITVSGVTTAPLREEVRGWLVRSDYTRAGSFTCDHDLLNRIHATTLWTFENLSLGGYVVDCPQRERMGYGGDAHATTKTALLHYHLGAFYTKWAQDWRDVQDADGNLPYTAPTYWGGGGPAWSGFIITLPWQVYLSYGDTRILAEGYPHMRSWLQFLETKQSGNVLQRWGGDWDFLGDWLWPTASGTNGKLVQTKFFNNCYWLYALQTTARIADILGLPEEAAAYRQRAEEVRAAVHAEFWKPGPRTYVTGVRGRMGYLAAALLVHLPPDENWIEVWRDFEKEIVTVRKGHLDSGITGGFFLFEALLANERDDLAALMLRQESYPGFGDMLNKGATTFWESWDAKGSFLHSSYLWAGAWFIEGAAGLRRDPVQPGWKHFYVKPGVTSGLREAAGSLETPYGLAATAWKIVDDNFLLTLVVPPNTQATVTIPSSQPESARSGGRLLEDAPGVLQLRPDGHAMTVLLESGTYDLSAPYDEKEMPGPRSFAAYMERLSGGPLAPPSRLSASADADGDGRANLWEYVAGTDPLMVDESNSSPLKIAAGRSNGSIEVTLALDVAEEADGYTYNVEYSNDPEIEGWVPWTGETSTSVAPLGNGWNRHLILLRPQSGELNEHSYYRLRLRAL